MKPFLAAAVLGYALAEAWTRRHELILRRQKTEYLRGGIAAYLSYIDSLPVKGGESV